MRLIRRVGLWLIILAALSAAVAILSAPKAPSLGGTREGDLVYSTDMDEF